MITVTESDLMGVKIIDVQAFEDHRGKYIETYNEKEYFDAGIEIRFVQDDYSISHKNVLRGLHGDQETWKLISCPIGKLLLAVVNYEKFSNQYLQWKTFELSEEKNRQILIPPKFANGHLVLSDRAVFNYKQSTYYMPGKQFSLRWDDARISIAWPTKNPILSDRDNSAKHLP